MYETDLTPEEKRLLNEIEGSQTTGGWGQLIGSGLGLGAGLLATAATGGTAAPFIPLLMGAGGQVGGMVGGNMGTSRAGSAMEQLQRLRELREGPTLEKQAQAEAFQRLLGSYNKYGV
jgi:hypothetical protein